MDSVSVLLTGGQALVLLILVLANGFFVAAEFSLVAMRRSRVQQMEEEGHPSAPALGRAMNHLDAYLAATQLGITMASIGLGWVGEPLLEGLIVRAFHVLPGSWEVVGAEVLAIAAAFSLVTTLHIVFGELAPKSLALKRSERTALLTVGPLALFLRVFRPVILVLNGLGNRTLKLLNLEPSGNEEAIHSIEELQLLVADSREAGLLSQEAERVVERAFRLDDLTARQVMVPRIQIDSVPLHASVENALEVAARTSRTHLPVRGATIDEITGVVDIVSLLRARHSNGVRSLEGLMRPALQVPETIRADRLLARMRGENQHLAILVDEYGGTSGLVSSNDLMKELLGPGSITGAPSSVAR